MSTEENNHDELDAELRRLFEDERLTMRPRDDAPATILAGARRLRRRRAAYTTAGGALAALVLVSGGLAVSWMRSPQTDTAAPAAPPSLSLSTDASSPETTPLTPTPSEPPQGSAPVQTRTSLPNSSEPTDKPGTGSVPSSARVQSLPLVAGPTLGPDGYGKLTLGMSYDTAKKTGMLKDSASSAPSGCGQYVLTEGTGGVRSVMISEKRGIVRFDASGAHTPERIRVGSSKSDLLTAYPDLSGESNGYEASAGSGATYVFSLDSRGQVASLALVSSGEDC